MHKVASALLKVSKRTFCTSSSFAFNRFNETHDGATWKRSRRKESIKKKAFTFYNESVSAKKTVVSLDHRYITIGIV
jgi:hypothetical protein